MTKPIRLGLLRLTDSAPAIVAATANLFEAAGIEVALQIEPSWANLADKLAWGGLDAAIMLAPLAAAAIAGLRGPKLRIKIPMGISRGGNSIVAATGTSASFASWLRAQASPPRFAVVHLFSSHTLLLHEFLAHAGFDAASAVDIVVVPPEKVVSELAAGHIAGFAAGAPWGDHAEACGAGKILTGTSAIRPHHLEKCLAVTESLAADANALAALTSALRRAQAICDTPAETPHIAQLLADELDLPQQAAAVALPGGTGSEKIEFAAAARISAADTAWFLDAMIAQGWLAPEDAKEVLRSVLF